ncbi:MAG: AEC family transporter [Herpetosiphonaceae bacterium]|nr:AEC family transporter [Herpetosiphonaceae bacterium]
MTATLRAFSEVLLPIVVIMAVGYTVRRCLLLDLRTLNRVSIYGLSPCLIFVTVLRTQVAGNEVLQLALLMLLVIVITCGCAWIIARLMKLSVRQRSGFMLSSGFMNSGNYGLPATRFAFGEAGFQYAVVGYLVQAVLSQTLAVYLASAGGGDRRRALLQVFRMPLVYAVLLALLLRLLGIQLTDADGFLATGLYRGLRLLADATLPFLLLILGMQLTEREPIGALAPLGTATLLRLVGAIPIAYVAALPLGLQGLPLHVGIVQAAMPTAVNMTILALEFDAWPQFVSNVVIATTVGSLVTLTALLLVLR